MVILVHQEEIVFIYHAVWKAEIEIGYQSTDGIIVWRSSWLSLKLVSHLDSFLPCSLEQHGHFGTAVPRHSSFLTMTLLSYVLYGGFPLLFN